MVGRTTDLGDSPLPGGRCEGAGGFDAWRELCRPVYDLHLTTPAGPFAAHWALRSVDGMVFTDVTFDAHALEHDPRRLRRYDNDFLLLEFYQQGSGRGVVGDAPTWIDEGRIHLVDFSKRYKTVTGRVRTRGVLIPHRSVGYDPARDRPYLSIPVAAPEGRMLTVAFRTLFEQIARPDLAVPSRLAAASAAIVQELLLSSRAPAQADSSDLVARCRDDAICSHIEAHLDDPDLGVEQLCRVFHVSRATLYRRFAAVGGISALIRARRLDRCRAELEARPTRTSKVRAVAERWGFFDASDFSRAFKRRFGMTPSEAYAAATSGHEHRPKAGSSLHEWLLRS